MASFLTAVNCLSFIINSLLHTSKAAALWVMIMQVFLFSFLMLSSTFSSVFLSSADVASSRRIIGALLINALAIARRCAWPSEIPRPFSPYKIYLINIHYYFMCICTFLCNRLPQKQVIILIIYLSYILLISENFWKYIIFFHP